MAQLEEGVLISNFANEVIGRHRNPVSVIKSLANLMCTMATMLDDTTKAKCASVLRDVADVMEKDLMRRMEKPR
ncbi:hypothetical protein [Bradyrhizobium sp. McL0615]|uniref:hypothetical protein n=1 Tax=Bradyrhizobium sp. McL0615 TaxID=3415673 RepID=UPI003CF42238